MDEELISQELDERGCSLDKQTFLKALAALVLDKAITQDRVSGERIYKILLYLKEPQQSAA